MMVARVRVVPRELMHVVLLIARETGSGANCGQVATSLEQESRRQKLDCLLVLATTCYCLIIRPWNLTEVV